MLFSVSYSGGSRGSANYKQIFLTKIETSQKKREKFKILLFYKLEIVKNN